jgi:hypothetical protein
VADEVLRLVRNGYGGSGGLILLRNDGGWAARHNTNRMPHAYSGLDGRVQVGVTNPVPMEGGGLSR